MTYKEVYGLLKKAAEDLGGYSYNGRLIDVQDDFGDRQPGTYGNPEKGSYGAALDARKNPGSQFITGSMSLPSGFAGRVTNITPQQASAKRRQLATRNAKAFSSDPKVQQWAQQNFRVGGRRNANSWMKNNQLAPQTTHQQWQKRSYISNPYSVAAIAIPLDF